MKTFAVCILMVTILSIVTVSPLFAEDQSVKSDRFQLFNAQYNSAMIQKSKTTVFDEKKLFKIDTQTGKTWMLIDVFKEGRDIIYWKTIKEGK